MSVKSSTELMLYVVLTMPTLNKAYLLLFIYLFIEVTNIKDHLSYLAGFQMYRHSKILLINPLKRGHLYYKASFSLQKEWPYKRGNTVML